MSQPNRNERLGALTAGIILVAVAATLLFTHRQEPSSVPTSIPVAVTAPDTVRTDTVKSAKKESNKKEGSKAKKSPKKATKPQPPLRDPLSEY